MDEKDSRSLLQLYISNCILVNLGDWRDIQKREEKEKEGQLRRPRTEQPEKKRRFQRTQRIEIEIKVEINRIKTEIANKESLLNTPSVLLSVIWE